MNRFQELNDQMAQLGILEASVNSKSDIVSTKSQVVNKFESNVSTKPVIKPSPKPILSRSDRNKDPSKRISWADSAISSQSPSSNRFEIYCVIT